MPAIMELWLFLCWNIKRNWTDVSNAGLAHVACDENEG